MFGPLLILALACTSSSKDDTSAAEDTGDTGAPEPATTCDDGLPVRTFQQVEESSALFALASDITLQTENGDIRLSEVWDGCDTWLFIPDNPSQADGDSWPRGIFERDLDDLFERAPANTVFVFGSNDRNEDDQQEAMDELKEEIADALADMDEATAAWWQERIHYVAGQYKDQEAWLGETIRDPGWGMVLDREQRLRYIGSFADVDRYNGSYGWFEPNISMAANEAVYSNYLAERAHRMANDGSTVVTVFDGDILSDGSWSGQRGTATVELPDAATMASFDTLEFDLTMNCNGEGEYGTCPAWDYLVYLYLCDEGQTTGCTTEFGRWITTYHRAGRYVHDASALLPLIAGGGTRTFEFYTTQQYVISLDLRLRDEGKPTRPAQARYLFTGGAFNVDYNSRYEPIEVEVPASATKVELATVISGHGQVSPGTCAEFCPTEHHFIVNGTDNEQVLDNAGTETGCMDMVDQGVIPNQYGTWWYGRSGWCPGWQVPVTTIDVTDQVTPGSTATISYEGYRDGQPYETGGANIVMTSWVVFHE